MKTRLTTRRFELWWRKAQAWFATQFASINVDFTPVEDKIDEVSDKLDEVKEVTAKETTAQEIKELILNEGVDKADEYAETINEIIGDWSNE